MKSDGEPVVEDVRYDLRYSLHPISHRTRFLSGARAATELGKDLSDTSGCGVLLFANFFLSQAFASSLDVSRFRCPPAQHSTSMAYTARDDGSVQGSCHPHQAQPSEDTSMPENVSACTAKVCCMMAGWTTALGTKELHVKLVTFANIVKASVLASGC